MKLYIFERKSQTNIPVLDLVFALALFDNDDDEDDDDLMTLGVWKLRLPLL